MTIQGGGGSWLWRCGTWMVLHSFPWGEILFGRFSFLRSFGQSCHTCFNIGWSSRKRITYIKPTFRCWTRCTVCLSTRTRTTTRCKSTPPPMSTPIIFITSSSSVRNCLLILFVKRIYLRWKSYTWFSHGKKVNLTWWYYPGQFRFIGLLIFVENETTQTNNDKHKAVIFGRVGIICSRETYFKTCFHIQVAS